MKQSEEKRREEKRRGDLRALETRKASHKRLAFEIMEARPGVEPRSTDLQSAA